MHVSRLPHQSTSAFLNKSRPQHPTTLTHAHAQISNPQSALLTNHEVLLHLLAEDAEYTGADSTCRQRKKPSGLNHVLRDGLTYLQSEASATTELVAKHPDRPLTLYRGPHSLFRALAPKYRLNKAEYLQLYNLRPSTQVMLELVIEEVSSAGFSFLPFFSTLLSLSLRRHCGERERERERSKQMQMLTGEFSYSRQERDLKKRNYTTSWLLSTMFSKRKRRAFRLEWRTWRCPR